MANCVGFMALSETPRQMSEEDAAEILILLEQSGVEVYVDGGWAVDALLGEPTRVHEDLDIATPHRFVSTVRALLEARGYAEIPRDHTRDCNFVLGDGAGREVDVHTYTFDENGKNIFGVAYLPEHFTGVGSINGCSVKCIAPEWLVKFHCGYLLDENDYHDVKLLCQRFGIALPAEYHRFEDVKAI